MLLRRGVESRRDNRSWRPQQRGKEVVEVDMALPRRADHTREDLLGPRAAGRAIPATDLAIDDGGADGVFGAPVGRVHVGGPQEGEHGRELAVEMGREALGRGQGGRRVDEPAQAGEQTPMGHGEPLIGDRLRIAPIAEREGVGEDGLHAGRPGAPRMVGVEQTTPAEQMRQTALVPRVGEAAIGRPAIANQHTVEVRAQDRGRVVKAPPGANRIHGGRRRRKRPQPVQHGADAPAGFIGTDDGTPADLGTQRVVGRRGHARRAMQGVGEAARRHPEPEAVAQQRRNLFERHADVFVQEHDEGHGAGPEVYIGGPQRVGRLQRMPALDASPTGNTTADVHVEAPYDRAHRGQIFLILRGDAGAPDRAAAVRTGRGERRGVGHIHARGNHAARPATIPDAGAPSRPPTPALWPVLGERRRLPKARAPRHVELLLQARILLLQSVARAFYGAVLARRPHQLLAQTRNVFLLAPDQIVAVLAGPARRLVSHTRFMADSREKYKYETVSLAPLRQRTR